MGRCQPTWEVHVTVAPLAVPFSSIRASGAALEMPVALFQFFCGTIPAVTAAPMLVPVPTNLMPMALGAAVAMAGPEAAARLPVRAARPVSSSPKTCRPPAPATHTRPLAIAGGAEGVKTPRVSPLFQSSRPRLEASKARSTAEPSGQPLSGPASVSAHTTPEPAVPELAESANHAPLPGARPCITGAWSALAPRTCQAFKKSPSGHAYTIGPSSGLFQETGPPSSWPSSRRDTGVGPPDFSAPVSASSECSCRPAPARAST